MASKRYVFQLDGRAVTVEAEQEGNCRYMVRIQEVGRGRERVAYLTGRDRHWML